ncbi:MAG TPA: hypothetical protein VFZ52_04070, partial [Chryseolinea sp.]
LQYFITVGEKKELFTYPGRQEGSPSDWDFNNRNPFEVRVVSKSSPVYIFDARADNDELSRAWNRASSFIPGTEPGKAEIRVVIDKLFTIDAENPKAANINDYSMRYYFGKKVTHNREILAGKKDIIFRGRSLANKPCWVQLALITKMGEAFGGMIKVDSISGDYKLSVKDLKKVRLVTLPRPYPTFLPYFFEDKREGSVDLREVETLQISIGPGIPESELNDRHALAIESVRLE